MKEGERLIKNTYFLFLDFLFVTLFSLTFWVIIWKTLSPSDAGIIATSTNVMIVLSSFAIFGLQTAIPKLVSEYKEENKWDKIKSLVSFSIKSTSITSFIILVILFLFSQSLSTFLKLPISAIYLIGVSIFIWSFWNLSSSILQGIQNMKQIFLTDVAGNLIKVASTTLLVLAGISYLGPLSGLLIGMVAVILLRKKVLQLRSRNSIDRREVVYKYALPAFIGSIALMIFSNTPYIILTIIKNTEATGIFVTAMTMVLPISVIPGTISGALFPITSELSVARNAKARQRYLINLVVRYIVFIMLPILVFMLFFITPIILLFSRMQYLPAVKPFPILAVASLVLGTGYVFHSSLFAVRKPLVNRNISILTAATFLLLSLPLTYYFSTIGLSVAYLVSVMTLSFSSLLYLKKSIGLKIPWGGIFKSVISVSAFSVILFFADIITASLFVKILITAFAFLIYVLLLVPLKFYTKEDIKILNYLIQRIPWLKKFVGPIIRLISKSV